MKTTTKPSGLIEASDRLSKDVLAAHADEIDARRSFPRRNLELLAQAGVSALMVPERYGGPGGGIADMVAVLENLARGCPSTAMVSLMHFLGTAVIAAAGADELKQTVLPQIAAGRHLTTLAFSEAGSGGHFYTPVSEPKPNGKAATLDAFKSFVTSAGEADSYVVSTRRPGATTPTDLDLYYVPKDTQGFEAQSPFEGMGLAGNASAAVRLVGLALFEANRLGGAGSGFQTMLSVVLPHFQLGSAAVSLGIASSAFDLATRHVSSRKYEQSGGTPLAAIPRVQFLTAEKALELRSAQAYLDETVRRVTSSDPQALLDVLSIKIKAADAALAVTSRAMTLGGGSAFGRRGGLERIFRDAQAAAVMAPSSDVLKDFLGKATLGLPLF